MQYIRWKEEVMGRRRAVWHAVEYKLGDYGDFYWTYCDKDLDFAFVDSTTDKPEDDICKVCERRTPAKEAHNDTGR